MLDIGDEDDSHSLFYLPFTKKNYHAPLAGVSETLAPENAATHQIYFHHPHYTSSS
jgi:hypothetical protein